MVLRESFAWLHSVGGNVSGEPVLRNRLASLLHRWAYRIDPPRPALMPLAEAIFSRMADAIAEERERRGWN